MKIVLVLSTVCGVLTLNMEALAASPQSQKAYQWTLSMVPQPSIECLEVQLPSGEILKRIVGSERAKLCPVPQNGGFWTYIFLRDRSNVEKCVELDANGQIRRMAPLNYCEPARKLENPE